MKTSRLPVALIATLAFATCHREHTPAIAHKLVGDDNQELRRAFNADVDKVRVIMLVSPS
jgi:hypothetical protein